MRKTTCLLTLLLAACGGDNESTAADAGAQDASPPEQDAAPPPVTLTNGLYAVGITLAEFGGLVLQSQLEVEVADGVFVAAKLRPVAGEMLGEVIGDAAGAELAGDGTFRLEFGDMLLPGAFSPTNSDVELNLVFAGSVRAADDFCGDTRGEVATFDTVLEGSTFAAAAWVDVNTPGPGACDAETNEMLPRIDECPSLSTGLVEGFETGGETRSFYLQVPEDYDEETLYPLVIVHHGVGGTPENLNDQADMRSMVDDQGFILVQPAGRDLSSAWASSAPGDNPDLALFDDIVRCVSEQFSVDAARIHSVGHSGGGYYNSFLAIRRGDILASTAGISPGLIIDYAAPSYPGPMLVAWGGADDFAYDQDFDLSSKKVMNTFAGNGHFVVACDHSVLPLREDLSYMASRHTWPMDGAAWVVRFLLDHPKGVDPLPYTMGLPADFPAEVCSIWMAE